MILWSRSRRTETDRAGGTGKASGTKTFLERMKSRFDPPEQKQTDRETDRAGGTGEGGTRNKEEQEKRS